MRLKSDPCTYFWPRIMSSARKWCGRCSSVSAEPRMAANGIEALQALERQHYDLVLMDVKMPKMDGLEATSIIRQRWPENGPKVVAVTAYALEGDREKCLEAGMDDYISKTGADGGAGCRFEAIQEEPSGMNIISGILLHHACLS